MGDLIQFIPRSRRSRDSDFPVIVFKGPVVPAHESAVASLDESGNPNVYVAPESDPA